MSCAAQKGRTDCVRLLLKFGADKDAKDSVCHENHEQYLNVHLCLRAWTKPFILRTLKKRLYVDLHLCQSQRQCAALLCAASKGQEECVRLLVKNGADAAV